MEMAKRQGRKRRKWNRLKLPGPLLNKAKGRERYLGADKDKASHRVRVRHRGVVATNLRMVAGKAKVLALAPHPGLPQRLVGQACRAAARISVMLDMFRVIPKARARPRVLVYGIGMAVEIVSARCVVLGMICETSAI